MPYSKLIKGKQYFINGMLSKSFHSNRFWKWVVYGMIQGMIICYFCYYANENAINREGCQNDIFSVGNYIFIKGSICYACIVFIVNIKLFVSTHNHTVVSLILIGLSPLIYYFVLYLMSQYFRFENFNDIYINFKSINYFLTVLEVIALCVLLDVGLGICFRYFGIVKKSDEEILLIHEEEKEDYLKKVLPKTEMVLKISEENNVVPCIYIVLFRLWLCIFLWFRPNASVYKKKVIIIIFFKCLYYSLL